MRIEDRNRAYNNKLEGITNTLASLSTEIDALIYATPEQEGLEAAKEHMQRALNSLYQIEKIAVDNRREEAKKVMFDIGRYDDDNAQLTETYNLMRKVLERSLGE